MRTAERVHVLELGPAINGVHPVPTDRGYRYVGDVATATVLKDGIEVKRWFAWTIVDAVLGPFPNRVKSIEALLEWNGMVQVEPTATIEPLFDLEGDGDG